MSTWRGLGGGRSIEDAASGCVSIQAGWWVQQVGPGGAEGCNGVA